MLLNDKSKKLKRDLTLVGSISINLAHVVILTVFLNFNKLQKPVDEELNLTAPVGKREKTKKESKSVKKEDRSKRNLEPEGLGRRLSSPNYSRSSFSAYEELQLSRSIVRL